MSSTMAQTLTSPTRLRQIALVAKDLDRARYLLTEVLGTQVLYIDPQVARWGIRNVLVALGGDVIEVCSPFQEGTTAGRLIDKRGDGGYMVIMQTTDAASQRRFIESNKLAKVIYSHEHDNVVCVQYHPKGILGGMMPELDSHTPTFSDLTRLDSKYSPWHACGKDYESYSRVMKRCAHLKLLNVTCRLAANDADTERAAKQWENVFGVARDGSELAFTNARLKFVPGVTGRSDGLESITVGVRGKREYNQVLDAAARLGLLNGNTIDMLGLNWHIALEIEGEEKSKL